MNEKNYKDLVRLVLNHGVEKRSRAGKTLSVTDTMLRLDMQTGFPILTGRKMHWEGVLAELVGFLRGYTTAEQFEALGCNYWRHNAFSDGNLGPIYGYQWRMFNGSCLNDQLESVVLSLRKRSVARARQLVVSAWNPAEEDEMCLPPCHYSFQVVPDYDRGTFSLIVNMRSVDVMLGLPSDMILYGFLMHVLQVDCNLWMDELIFMMGDTHIYENHLDGADEYLTRPTFAPPDVVLISNGPDDVYVIDSLEAKDFLVDRYVSQIPIKFALN